jgi:hypothetical protein
MSNVNELGPLYEILNATFIDVPNVVVLTIPEPLSEPILVPDNPFHQKHGRGKRRRRHRGRHISRKC